MHDSTVAAATIKDAQNLFTVQFPPSGWSPRNWRSGLRRTFDPRVLERLALIALGRAAGFSLDEMAGMFATDGKLKIDRKVLAAKADELDRTIRELTAMRDGLRHAVACKAPSHMECPKFQRILRAASVRKRSAGKKSGSHGARRSGYS